MWIVLLVIFLLALVVGTLMFAGYALLHDYPIWSVVAAVVGVAVVFAVTGVTLALAAH